MGKLSPSYVSLLKEYGAKLKLAKQRAGLIPAPKGSEPYHSMVWGPVRHHQEREVARLKSMIKLMGNAALVNREKGIHHNEKVVRGFTQGIINKARVKNHPTPTKHKAPGPYDDILHMIRVDEEANRRFAEQSRRFAAHEDFTKGIIEKARGKTKKVKPALHTKSPKVDEEKLHSFTQGIIDMARGPKEVKKRKVRVSGPYDDLLGKPPKRPQGVGGAVYDLMYRVNPHIQPVQDIHHDWVGKPHKINDKDWKTLQKIQNLGREHANAHQRIYKSRKAAKQMLNIGYPESAKAHFETSKNFRELTKDILKDWEAEVDFNRNWFGPTKNLRKNADKHFNIYEPRTPRKLKTEEPKPFEDMFTREDKGKRLRQFTATGIVSVPARRKP